MKQDALWKKEYSLKITLINNENTNALVYIAQEDDSNNFELLQNL